MNMRFLIVNLTKIAESFLRRATAGIMNMTPSGRINTIQYESALHL